MGISFKVSRKGTRFYPKVLPSDTVSVVEDDDADTSKGYDPIFVKNVSASKSTGKLPVASTEEEDPEISDSEVSFTLNLFVDGYSIGSPSENEVDHQSNLKNVPKFLHPYDRTSETLFSAIESGRLPGDILDDIPCKYVNGTLVCEVQDYRKCASQPGVNGPCVSNNPIINKVRLRMSLENVVKDIPLISDNSWTYGDLMEVESRILKALQPKICLDPTPNLDRLCQRPVSSKLNLGLSSIRRKRLRQIPEVHETSNNNNNINGKKTCIDRMPESSNCRLGNPASIIQQPALENMPTLHQNIGQSTMIALRPKPFAQDASVPSSPSISQQQPKYQTGPGNPTRLMQDHGPGPVFNAPSSGQDMMNSYTDNINSSVSSLHGKRESQDAQLSKRSRLTSMGLDGGQQQQQQHMGPQHMDGFNGLDSQWKNTLLQQQQQHSLARGIQYANSPGMQKYPQQMFEGGFNQESGPMPFNVGGQQGIRYGLKEEPVEDKTELGRNKNDMHIVVETEINHMDPQHQSRLQQRGPPQQFMRSSFPQTPWNSLGQNLESNNSRKEEQFSKRKLVQSPRVSAGGGLPQSPLSSKSGEFSSGSIGPQFGAVAATNAVGLSHKDKSAAVTSVHAAAASLTSCANESMQRQQQQHQAAQMSVKRRTNSLPKTPAPMSGIASPASVSNMGVSLNASSPSIGTPPLADQVVLERFSKIEMLSVRFRLNVKKNKKDEYPVRKPSTYPDKQLRLHLSNDSSGENFKDETCKMPLSKSLIGGSINVCKTRVLNFVQTERILQGNGFSLVPKIRTRLIMSEKPNDGTVAMHYGEIEDAEYLATEDYLPTLASTHIADLLAAQFCSLMVRDGYHVEDHVQPKPVQINRPTNSQPNAPNSGGLEIQQQLNSEAAPPQTPNEVPKPSNSSGSNQQLNSVSQNNNIMAGTRMLPPGNAQALQQQMTHGGLLPPSRSQQQTDSQQPSAIQQQQQLHQNQQQQQQHSLMQQQHSQFQRSPLMLAGAANPLSQLNAMGQNSNMQLGNQMVNKPSPLQLQMLQQQQQMQAQQQQQQQQPPQMQQQRKMMMGLGTVGMGNINSNSNNNSNSSNNMVGLQGLGNVMGMGAGARVGAGLSAPMGSMSGGMGNVVGQSTMNLSQASNISNAISQQLRSGQLTPQQAAFMTSKLRMVQNRTNMLGGTQSSIAGMPGAVRQMHPGGASGLSMLGSNLNRSNINPMLLQQQQQQQQRTAMGPMGPPKLMTGMNLYMNQTQQQQLQLQQQQMQQQQQQQLQQQQQQQQQFQQPQQETSPLQTVVSPPQVVGSPSTMVIPQQQQASPQQMSQRTPMSPQLSSGAIHPMSGGGGGGVNQEACPASPQLSSQTMGSVTSITHSPMDLQGGGGVNNTSSAGNP